MHHVSRRRAQSAFFVAVIAIALLLLLRSRTSRPSVPPAVQAPIFRMTAQGFVPASLQVSRNSSVCWENVDVVPHHPVADVPAGFLPSSPPPFDPGKDIAPREMWCFPFPTAGSWTFRDKLQKKSTGTLQVTK